MKKELKAIITNLQNELKSYKEIPNVNLQNGIRDYMWASICSDPNKEQIICDLTKQLSNSFYGTIVKATNQEHSNDMYKGLFLSRNEGKIQYFTKVNPYGKVLDKVSELLKPFLEFYLKQKVTIISKDFLMEVMLGRNNDFMNNTLLYGREGQTRKLDTIAGFIEEEKFDELCKYIEKSIDEAIEKYKEREKEIRKGFKERTKIYLVEGDYSDPMITIITVYGDMYHLSKGGQMAPLGNHFNELKELSKMIGENPYPLFIPEKY